MTRISSAGPFKRKERKRFHALTKIHHIKRAVTKIKTSETYKNTMPTSLTDADFSSIKKPTLNTNQDDDSDDDDEVLAIEKLYQTLTRIKDEETGVVKLVKNKKQSVSEKTPFIHRASTHKQIGETVFMPMKVKIVENGSKKNEKIEIDQVKNYEIYFPHNNIKKVIEQMKSKKTKKPTWNLNLATEQDLLNFKVRLGKIFEQARKKSSNTDTSLKSLSPRSRRKSTVPGQPYPYERKRSRSLSKPLNNAIAKHIASKLRPSSVKSVGI